MNFCVVALQHTSADVRQVAERIIKALYREVGQPVKEYLPPDDDKTRKNTMWRLLFEYFDKVDGKPSKSDIKVTRAKHSQGNQINIFFVFLFKSLKHVFRDGTTYIMAYFVETYGGNLSGSKSCQEFDYDLKMQHTEMQHIDIACSYKKSHQILSSKKP